MTSTPINSTISPTTKTADATNADGLLTDSLVLPKEQLMGKVYPIDRKVNTLPQPIPEKRFLTSAELAECTGFVFKDPFREMVFARAGGFCWYCGLPIFPWNFHIDHFVPVAYGGENTWSNLVPACPHCNMSKGAKTIKEFRWSIQQKRAGVPRFSPDQQYWLFKQGFVFPELPEHQFWFEMEGLEL